MSWLWCYQHHFAMMCAAWCFDLMAYFASGDIVSYSGIWCGPVEVPGNLLVGFKSSILARFMIVAETAYEFVVKQVILSVTYPLFIGEIFGTGFTSVTLVFLYFVYSLQIRNINDWRVSDPLLHIGGQRVNHLGCFNFLKEVIVQFNGGSCQGCQLPHSGSLIPYLIVRPSWWSIGSDLLAFQVFDDKGIEG